MPAQKQLSCFGHAIAIEWWRHMPNAVLVQHGRRAAVENAINVDTTLGGASRVEIVADRLGAEHRYSGGAHMMIERAPDLFRRIGAGQIEMRGHTQRMNTGVGAAGAMHRGVPTAVKPDCVFQ